MAAGANWRSGHPDASVAARDDDIDNNNDNNNGFRVVCAASTFFCPFSSQQSALPTRATFGSSNAA